MNDRRKKTDRLAVLIDAENVSARSIEPLLEEITKFGTATVKRIYGDWTLPHVSKWKLILSRYALQPIQQFRLVAGKNSTDCALIIDAMDLLYTNKFDAFCIVSSDSDFTRLASRIRESGLIVYGFGEKKTPESFVNACDRFIITEILEGRAQFVESAARSLLTERSGSGVAPISHEAETDSEAATGASASSDEATTHDAVILSNKEGTTPVSKKDQNLLNVVKTAYEAVAGEDGWAHLASLGGQIQKLSPSFDPRNFGHKKLGRSQFRGDV